MTRSVEVSDATIDRIIQALDEYAREVSRYDYGLPRHEASVENMRQLVREALADDREAQP